MATEGQTFLEVCKQGRMRDVREMVEQKGMDIEATVDGKGMCGTHWAASRGQIKVLKFLLDQGADVEHVDNDHWTPLHWAACHNHKQAALLLMEWGADPTRKDSEGHTPAMVARDYGHTKTLELLEQKEKEITEELDGKVNPKGYFDACRNGELDDVATWLDETGVDIKLEMDRWGRSGIHWAARMGHRDVVELLLDRGVDVDLVGTSDFRTPLHYAALYGHLSTAQLLLERGADLTKKDKKCKTPKQLVPRASVSLVELLEQKAREVGAEEEAQEQEIEVDPKGYFDACRNGRYDDVEYWLDKKGVNAAGEMDKMGRTGIHWAARMGHKDVVQLLLDRGADLDLGGGTDCRTPLHYAAMFGFEGIARLLLQRGADVTKKDRRDKTPRQLAAMNGHNTQLLLMLEKKEKELQAAAESSMNAGKPDANDYIKACRKGKLFEVKEWIEVRQLDAKSTMDHNGWTGVHWAAYECNMDIVKFLLNSGADVDQADEVNSRTPLHYAALYGQKAIATFLLERGANPKVEDKDGKIPRQLAIFNGYHPLANMLKKKEEEMERESEASEDKKYGKRKSSTSINRNQKRKPSWRFEGEAEKKSDT